MKLHTIVLWYLLFCSSCAMSNADEKTTSMENDIKNNKVEFYLYPTGNFSDIRYSIIVESNTLIIKNHDSLVGTRIPQGKNKQQLSASQLKKLETLISETKIVKENVPLITMDTWECKLIVNNDTVYTNPCFTYESLKGKQSLLEYLLSLLPVKLELYGFS